VYEYSQEDEFPADPCAGHVLALEGARGRSVRKTGDPVEGIAGESGGAGRRERGAPLIDTKHMPTCRYTTAPAWAS
jgi:hypothetical protein